MTYTSYPFDNQDTSESQYSALFRELQDSGVVDSFGGTGLAVSANASAMSVSLAPGSAIVRGFFFNNDASATLPIGAAGAAVRYDAVILRCDPTANSIVPAVVANAGQIPVLTQTATGIYEILLAVVTVPTSASTIAAGNVADRRAYVSSRMGVWTTANRPSAPRQHQMGVNTDNGGRIEQYVGTAWTNRLGVYWGSGAAFPTAGISAGDTFKHSTYGPMTYDGTQWVPGPGSNIYGSMWRVEGFSGNLAANTYYTTGMGSSYCTGGFTQINGNSNSRLVVPLDGFYRITQRAYATSGPAPYSITFYMNRTRAGVADILFGSVGFTKSDGFDQIHYGHEVVALKAGDQLFQSVYASGTGANYYGTNGNTGVKLEAVYVAPLNGASPA